MEAKNQRRLAFVESLATKASPLELVLRTTPNSSEITVQKSNGKNPVVYRFAMERQKLFEQVQDSLRKARKRMLNYANQKRTLLEFSEDDRCCSNKLHKS